jgi:hypothetical protein
MDLVLGVFVSFLLAFICICMMLMLLSATFPKSFGEARERIDLWISERITRRDHD